MTLRDADLRALVDARGAPVPGALRVHELGCGLVRVDVAYLHEQLWHAVELKGDTDTLTRLPGQVAGYSRTFDTAELVTTAHHLDRAAEILPGWWTLTVAVPVPDDETGHAVLQTVRPGTSNPAVARPGLVEQLWLAETGRLVAEHVPAPARRGTSRWTRAQLHRLLTEHLRAEQLRAVVTQALRGRDGWLDATGRNRAGTEQSRAERERRRQEQKARRARHEATVRRLITVGALTEDGELPPM